MSTAPWDQIKPTYSHIIAGETGPPGERSARPRAALLHRRGRLGRPTPSSDIWRHCIVNVNTPIVEEFAGELLLAFGEHYYLPLPRRSRERRR